MTWREILKDEIEQPYFYHLLNLIKNERRSQTIYPKHEDVFNALVLTPYEEVKVVIIGQDPYHGENQAHGLAFSVLEGNPMPPSLRNIFIELHGDLGIRRRNTDLSDWAKEGVLLLNTILTVRKSEPLSHQNYGWQKFTTKIIEAVNQKDSPVVFILWGNNAIEFKKYLNNPKHLVLTSSHPSPLSARYSFFGSRPFSKTNKFLIQNGVKPINW
ncbi:MAG TPA: uracil-DNA glycosylase [Acholeplasmataceae bacterium]|nr:uracil-DNA glycosylase [Acholeplasmataceae bacterium]HQC30406.1 uracil-DNA glycosylase [Acholeplasmataceae bacterium]